MLYLKFNVNRAGQCSQINLDLPHVGIIGLFGHSGVGKTTLLRIVAGLDSYEQVVLKFNNQIWQDDNVFIPTHLRKIGYVFQDSRLFNHLSVIQNLSFASKKSNITVDQFNKIIDDLKLNSLLDRMPNKLSGGEQQLIAFARCLVSKPDLLLLDEPFNAVDSATSWFLIDYVRNLNLPTMYVSHSVEEIMKISDYVIHLDNDAKFKYGSLNKMLPYLRRNGFVLFGNLISYVNGLCHYQTHIGKLCFLSVNAPQHARIYAYAHDLKIFSYHADGRVKALINSYENITSFYFKLNLIIADKEFCISIFKEQLSEVMPIAGLTIYIDIVCAEII